jgi:hypothetical protein
MSFEVVTDYPSHTIYAPLNTTIDADRDYGLASLDACACNGGMARTQMQLGGAPMQPELSPGMDGLDAAEQSMWLWGLLGASVLVWWFVLRPDAEDAAYTNEWWESRRA